MYLSVQRIRGKSKKYGEPKGVVTFKDCLVLTIYATW